MLGSIYKYRSFIWTHAISDVRHRYAGSNMGMVWNVLHPLALITVYSLVFSTLMKNSLPGIPGKFAYTIFLCCGFFPWIAFGECVTRGCNAFSINAAYLKKLPIPEQVFVAQTAASASLGLCISFALLIVLSLVLGFRPTWYWLLLPLPMILLQLAGFGIGLLCGTLNVFFTDVSQLVTIALQLLFWLTPIVYPIELVPAWLRPALYLHPFTAALQATRSLFLYNQLPPTWTWIAMAVWAVVAPIVGGLVLHRLRHEIRDVL